MVTSESLHTNNFISGAIEAPRYSCALGGAYATAVGIFGVVPILIPGQDVESDSFSANFMQAARMPEVLMVEQVLPVLL